MIKYNPKGALCPELAKAMTRIFHLLEKHGLMANVAITDGRMVEFFTGLDPDWSCCRANKLPGGEIQIRFKSQRVDYPSREKQKEAAERTINGLALLFKCQQMQLEQLSTVIESLRRVFSFEHYGEEFKAHTAEPPDPDKIPETLDEAVELITATLDKDAVQYVIRTPLFEAIPHLHNGFGRGLRNQWKLWEGDSPLQKFVLEKYKIFGHPDDITTLIFTALWGKVRGEPAEVIEASLQLEAEGIKNYWQTQGTNPETGEKSLMP